MLTHHQDDKVLNTKYSINLKKLCHILTDYNRELVKYEKKHQLKCGHLYCCRNGT